jgi:hypothetical protein
MTARRAGAAAGTAVTALAANRGPHCTWCANGRRRRGRKNHLGLLLACPHEQEIIEITDSNCQASPGYKTSSVSWALTQQSSGLQKS